MRGQLRVFRGIACLIYSTLSLKKMHLFIFRVRPTVEASFSEGAEDFIHGTDVFLHWVGLDNQIIDIDEAGFPLSFRQDHV